MSIRSRCYFSHDIHLCDFISIRKYVWYIFLMPAFMNWFQFAWLLIEVIDINIGRHAVTLWCENLYVGTHIH